MATQRSASALAAAKRLFARKPGATTDDFRKVLERADKRLIGNLTNRQLNASYVLPLKRRAATQAALGVRAAPPAKKVKTTVPTKRLGRPPKKKVGKRRGRIPMSVDERMARLIQKRDAELLAASGDTMKVYELAAGVGDFAKKLLKLTEG